MVKLRQCLIRWLHHRSVLFSHPSGSAHYWVKLRNVWYSDCTIDLCYLVTLQVAPTIGLNCANVWNDDCIIELLFNNVTFQASSETHGQSHFFYLLAAHSSLSLLEQLLEPFSSKRGVFDAQVRILPGLLIFLSFFRGKIWNALRICVSYVKEVRPIVGFWRRLSGNAHYSVQWCKCLTVTAS
jgi:hypothetical protein